VIPLLPGLAAMSAILAANIININEWVIGGLLRSARSAAIAPPKPAMPTATHSQAVVSVGSAPSVITKSGAKIQYAAETNPIANANNDKRNSRAHCNRLIGGAGAASVGVTGETDGNIRQAATMPSVASTAKDK
jgi:hypothetical protein